MYNLHYRLYRWVHNVCFKFYYILNIEDLETGITELECTISHITNNNKKKKKLKS